MNNWYELSLVLESEHKKIHILDTQSLEVAENKKIELVSTGLKVVINEWNINNEVPVLVGEIK